MLSHLLPLPYWPECADAVSEFGSGSDELKREERRKICDSESRRVGLKEGHWVAPRPSLSPPSRHAEAIPALLE